MLRFRMKNNQHKFNFYDSIENLKIDLKWYESLAFPSDKYRKLECEKNVQNAIKKSLLKNILNFVLKHFFTI
jgi:hypothetical protein